MKVKITRCTTVSPLQLLTHLWDTYDRVTIENLKVNETQMKIQWNPPLLIESHFLQLEEEQSFAAKGNEKIDDSLLV